MPPPPFWARFRQVIGRAFRETGQALDRVGVRGAEHALRPPTLAAPVDYYVFNDILSRHRHRMPLLRRGEPKIDPNVEFLAPCSTLIGNITIGPGSSVWYGAVLRADRCNSGMGNSEEVIEEWRYMDREQREFEDRQLNDSSGGGGIYIGQNTNVQDGVIITADRGHTVIGDGVTIGHAALINSATIESNCLIGMGSVINPGAKIEKFSFVAAGAVIGEGVTVNSGELWVGNPGRKLRDLTEEEKNKLIYQANEYVLVAASQKQVMELGGNVSDNVIDQLMIRASENIEQTPPPLNQPDREEKKVELRENLEQVASSQKPDEDDQEREIIKNKVA